MTEAEMQLIRIYMTGFAENPSEWTPEKHLAGIKAVFAAGADAGKRSVNGATNV